MKDARVAVVGATGRMGCAVVRLAVEDGARVVAAVGAEHHGRDVGELAGVGAIGVTVAADLAALDGVVADLVVDFSAPVATAALAERLAQGVGAAPALVSGTTGLGADGLGALERASLRCPVLWEPNMSVGVHVLARLVQQAVALSGREVEVEIVEAHHHLKVDAPSGTALRLYEVARAAKGGDAAMVPGRSGRPGRRSPQEIGVHAVRGGDVIGDHTVHLFLDGERLELTHRASSRDLFARGALRCGAWLIGKPPRRYTLADVLGG